MVSYSPKQHRHRLFLQQGLSITGAGYSCFDDAITGLKLIHAIFKRELPENHLDRYHPLTFQSFPSLAASNRYFSLRKNISSPAILQFPQDIDPNGILKSIAGHDLVYADDNVVKFYTKSNNRFDVI
jgi:hypothetical protein